MKKIVLFGPESTGKTLLAQELASHYDTAMVPENARLYLEAKRKYYDYYIGGAEQICTQEDILPIVLGQLSLEETMMPYAKQYLICDTNPLQTATYVSYYYQTAYKWLHQIIGERQYDLYLLTDIDIPWEADALRDRPNNREEMIELFEDTLKKHNLPYYKVQGILSERKMNAIAKIDQHIFK